MSVSMWNRLKWSRNTFSPEDGGNLYLRNSGIYLQVDTELVVIRKPTLNGLNKLIHDVQNLTGAVNFSSRKGV
jgi:hypothetical protein